MQDIANDFLTIAQAARLLPNRPQPGTIWRWRTKGIRGIKLDTCLVGGRRYVRKQSIVDFIERVTAAADHSQADEPAPTRSAETSARLDAEGLLESKPCGRPRKAMATP